MCPDFALLVLFVSHLGSLSAFRNGGSVADPRDFRIQRIALMLGRTHVSLIPINPNFFATNHRHKRQNPAYQTLLRVLFPEAFAIHEQVPVQDGGA
jgi:hypothetical protein